MSYSHDRQWSDCYLPAVKAILKQNASFLVEFEIAPPDIDLKEVGDIVLCSSMGHIGVRVRRPDVMYRDLTIRSRRASGVETELHKIRKGFCRWYLYGWADGSMPGGSGQFKHWIIVDMDMLRETKLIYQNRREIANNEPFERERTWFIPYSIPELDLHKCIVAMHNDLMKEIDKRLSSVSKEKAKPISEQLSLFDPAAYGLRLGYYQGDNV